MESPQTTQTQMTNPPKDQKKLVKVKVLRDIYFGNTVVRPGAVVEMSEDQIAKFCDTSFKGPYAFDGEVASKKPKSHKVVRAMRLTEWEALEARRLREEQEED